MGTIKGKRSIAGALNTNAKIKHLKVSLFHKKKSPTKMMFNNYLPALNPSLKP